MNFTIILQIAQFLFYSVGILIGLYYIIQYIRLREVRKTEFAQNFVTVTERFHSLEKLFIQHGELSSLAHEIYQKSGYPNEISQTTIDLTPTASIKKQEMEFHTCAIMIQLMEDVWCTHGLYNNQRYDDPIMSGWMTLFHDWYNADIFKRNFVKLKYIYSKPFYYFVENKVKNYTPERDHDLTHEH